MAHLGTLKNFRFNQDVDDIRGADVYSRDGEDVGDISDVIFDHGSGSVLYVIIETGTWLDSRNIAVPPDALRPRGDSNDEFQVNLSRAQIRDLPGYEDRHLENEADWKEFEQRTRAAWEADPVLHKAGSSRIITPEPDEMPVAGGGEPIAADVEPHRIAGKFPDPAPDPSKIRLRPAGIAERAEDSKIPGQPIIATEPAEWERSADEIARLAQLKKQRVPGSVENPAHDYTAAGDVFVRDENVPASESISQHDQRIASEVARDKGVIGSDEMNRGIRAVNDEPVDINQPHVAPRQDPRAYQGHFEAHAEANVERHSRLRDFEQHLRRNRVDVTSSCRACGVERDKAA